VGAYKYPGNETGQGWTYRSRSYLAAILGYSQGALFAFRHVIIVAQIAVVRVALLVGVLAVLAAVAIQV
jgi:hypothetical protein